MGKEHHEGEDCCHACERWAAGNTEAVARPPLEPVTPSQVELVVTRRGTPVMSYVPTDASFTIGRGSKNALRLDDGALSRMQAAVSIRSDGVYIEDGHSTCGTYVDGALTHGPTRVGDGSVISFGNHDIRIVRR